MAKKWHKKHISMKWGLIVLGVLIIGIVLLIPLLQKEQDTRSEAATDTCRSAAHSKFRSCRSTANSKFRSCRSTAYSKFRSCRSTGAASCYKEYDDALSSCDINYDNALSFCYKEYSHALDSNCQPLSCSAQKGLCMGSGTCGGESGKIVRATGCRTGTVCCVL